MSKRVLASGSRLGRFQRARIGGDETGQWRIHLPNGVSVLFSGTVIYLALRGVERKWRAPPQFWHASRVEFVTSLGAQSGNAFGRSNRKGYNCRNRRTASGSAKGGPHAYFLTLTGQREFRPELATVSRKTSPHCPGRTSTIDFRE